MSGEALYSVARAESSVLPQTQLIRGLHNIRAIHQGGVLSIGNFDGVHLGHRQVLRRLVAEAKHRNTCSIVMLFEPQPQEFFGRMTLHRLSRFREKWQQLRKTGVDYVLCVRFDRNFSDLSAEDFVQRVLQGALKTRYVMVGEDFHFGAKRQGDFAFLQQMGEQYGFDVVAAETFQMGGERVSSTRIRALMQQGDLSAATVLLGQAYRLYGRVRHGKKLGRQLGFPTANLALCRKCSPLQGVLAVTVRGVGDSLLYGVASLGSRPTVSGSEVLLEVYLFDFNEDIYGAHLEVIFHHYLRQECRFETLDDMVVQIRQDVIQAKDFFREHEII
jgi:riboflavin kinase / FMN adenylyltransferase